MFETYLDTVNIFLNDFEEEETDVIDSFDINQKVKAETIDELIEKALHLVSPNNPNKNAVYFCEILTNSKTGMDETEMEIKFYLKDCVYFAKDELDLTEYELVRLPYAIICFLVGNKEQDLSEEDFDDYPPTED